MRNYGFSILGGRRGNAAQIKKASATSAPAAHSKRLANPGWLLSLLLCLLPASQLSAQTGSDLDLSTRSVGVPPAHTTVDSVARWMENPLDQKMTIAVTNLCADTTNCLVITLGSHSLKFYGAGMDEWGNYIPTNYPPMIVSAVLRREYQVSIICPNSGPQGCALFNITNDFTDPGPDSTIQALTNGTSAPAVSAYLWTNFTAPARAVFTNGDSSVDPSLIGLRHTNLVVEMNRIITTQSFYTNALFASYTNDTVIADLMATNPTASQICYVNRLLLYATVNFTQPSDAPDSSGTAQITFGVKPPPELKIKKNQPAPSYTVLINRDSGPKGVLNLLNPGTGFASTNYPIVEILKDKFGHFGLGDGCDDATKAPGQGSWLSMGPGCTEDTNRIALEWHVSLGRTFDGLAAGQIALHEPGLARSSYTPFALYYNGSMTNLYATETMLPTNLPNVFTNADGIIQTNQFTPEILSENVWTNGGQIYTNCLVPVSLVMNPIPFEVVTNIHSGFIYPNLYFTNVYMILFVADELNFSGCVGGYVTNYDGTNVFNNTWSFGFTKFFSDPGTLPSPAFYGIGTNGQLMGDYINCITNQGGQVLASGFRQLFSAPDMLHGYYGMITNVTTNYEAVIRQVKGYQTFVDVVTPDTNQTVLKFYFASQVGTNRDYTGLYTNITNSPFVTYTLQNPEPATCNKLNLIETRNGSSTTQSLAKAFSAGKTTWTLKLGSGPETCRETREVTFSGGAEPTDRVEVNTIAYNSTPNSPAYQCTETYHSYPWGWELKETSISNNPDYVTIYDYYTNRDEPYGNFGYGQLKQIVYPDGFWEKRIYENVDSPSQFWDVVNYAPGLLRYILYPLDGNSGGNNQVETASLDNSAVDEFGYNSPSANSSATQINTGNSRLTYKFHGQNRNVCLQADEAASGELQQTDGVCLASWSGKIAYCDGDADGSQSTSIQKYSDQSGAGLAGHSFLNLYMNGNPDRFYYYDHGVYNIESKKFELNPTNHLYANTALKCIYPDHRETVLDYIGSIDWYYRLDFGDAFLGIYNDLFHLGFNWQGEICASIDDHSLTSIRYGAATFDAGPIVLYPYRSVKNVKIFHAGNLSQTEQYLYVGSGQWRSLFKMIYSADSLGRTTNIMRFDSLSEVTRNIYNASYIDIGGSDSDVLMSETDEFGNIKSFSYDSLKRLTTTKVSGHGQQSDVSTVSIYDANGRAIKTITTAGLGGGMVTQNQSVSYDSVGRITNQVSNSGVAVQTVYSADNLSCTKISPGNIIVTNAQYRDRRPKSLTGNGVVNEYYSYSECGGFGYGFNWENAHVAFRIKKANLAQSNSLRWSSTGTDWYGFSNAYSEKPVGVGTTNTLWTYFEYSGWTKGLCRHEFHSLGTPSIGFDYNVYGHLSLKLQDSIVDDYNNDYVDEVDRRTSVDESAVEINGKLYHAITNYISLVAGSSEKTVTSIHLEKMNGFQLGEVTMIIDYDADLNETITTTTVDRANNKLTTVTSQPHTSSLSATTVYQNGQPISASTLSVASPTVTKYDALGRTNEIISPLGYHAYINYDPATGWVTSQTDFTGQTTSYQYYNTNEANAGKLKCQTSATGKKTYYAYTSRGELYHTWGDVPYPAEYRYSEYGDLTNLITYRGGTGWTGSTWPASPGTGDNTCWTYDAASGALLKKTDAQTNSVTYTYYPETGRLLTRSWQRTIGGTPVTVTNFYDTSYRDQNGLGVPHDDQAGFGDLVRQEYNDGTPNVYFTNACFTHYNRAGQPRVIIDGSGTNNLVYDFASRLVASTCVGGMLNGLTVSNHFNPYYGRDALSVQIANNPVIQQSFGYDAYGRLATVGSGTCTATYGYAPSSDLLQSTTFKNGSSTVLTTTRAWDYGLRLHSIANVVDSTPVTAHSYQYDALNRRTQATLEDGSAWNYNYDDRDELTSASRQWSDTTAVTGQQFGYNYDNIGNRQQSGGGASPPITYTANSLNQYTGIVTPGLQDIIGAALATNPVTVNGGLADRHAEYFHRQVSVANTNLAVWQNVTNIAGTFTNKGGSVFPANSQTLAYDADGNLSFDGIWSYQWDGENRLAAMWMTNANGIANLAPTNRLRLDFAYDGIGRRVQKIVSTWSGTNFVAQLTNRFVYDGWNLLAVVNPQSAILQSFMWGKDLSGNLQGAGGVGGLLMASISGTNCFAGYDGNGNITSLINATDKSIAARYEYSPYGELLRDTGQFARQNPFRFSTKYWDEETSLIDYPSRYYAPSFGRWLSKDSLQEKGGINLFAFVKNNPVGGFDPMGKASGTLVDTDAAMSEGEALEGGGAASADGILGEIRQTVNTFNNIQKESVALMDSATGDTTELYIDLLENADSQISEGFGDLVSGFGRTGVEQYEKHHIFPQEFGKAFQQAGIKIDEFLVRLNKIDHIGVHQGGWNADWASFLEGGGKSASDMFNFALDMMQKYGCDASVLY